MKEIREKEKNDVKNNGVNEIKKEKNIYKNVIDGIENKEKIPLEKNNIDKKHNTTCCLIL